MNDVLKDIVPEGAGGETHAVLVQKEVRKLPMRIKSYFLKILLGVLMRLKQLYLVLLHITVINELAEISNTLVSRSTSFNVRFATSNALSPV